MRRIAGLRGLVHDAVEAITNLVEETGDRSARRTVSTLNVLAPSPAPAEAANAARQAVAGTVFDAIRLVNRTVQRAGDLASDAISAGTQKLAIDRAALGATVGVPPALTAQVAPVIDALEAGLNAVVGDFLASRSNGLAIELGLYLHGERIAITPEGMRKAFPEATGRIAIFVHGLGCTEAAWAFHAGDFYEDPSTCYAGELGRDLAYTSLFVRYNSGRHVSENGRELSALLEAVLAAYPVPVERIALIGHSMGGLVSRSAAHYGGLAGAQWIQKLSHLVCIGSPHLGAPLERASNVLANILGMFAVAGTEVPAKIINARSAGIKDLRFGYSLDEEWTGQDPDAWLKDGRRDVPLLTHVTYGFIAGSYSRNPDSPLGNLLGDLLVRVPSSTGRADEEARHVPFHVGEVLYGIHHLALLNHPEVYAVLKRLLDPALSNVAALEASVAQHEATLGLASPEQAATVGAAESARE